MVRGILLLLALASAVALGNAQSCDPLAPDEGSFSCTSGSDEGSACSLSCPSGLAPAGATAGSVLSGDDDGFERRWAPQREPELI